MIIQLLVLLLGTVLGLPLENAIHNLFFEVSDEAIDSIQMEIINQLSQHETVSLSIELAILRSLNSNQFEFSIALLDEMSCSEFSLATFIDSYQSDIDNKNKETQQQNDYNFQKEVCSEDHFRSNNICILNLPSNHSHSMHLRVSVKCLSQSPCTGKLYFSTSIRKTITQNKQYFSLRTPANLFEISVDIFLNLHVNELHLAIEQSPIHKLTLISQHTKNNSCFEFDPYSKVISISSTCFNLDNTSSNKIITNPIQFIIFNFAETYWVGFIQLTKYFTVIEGTTTTIIQEENKDYLLLYSKTVRACEFHFYSHRLKLSSGFKYKLPKNLLKEGSLGISCKTNSLFIYDTFLELQNFKHLLAPTPSIPAFISSLKSQNMSKESQECFLLHIPEKDISKEGVIATVFFFDEDQGIQYKMKTKEQIKVIADIEKLEKSQFSFEKFELTPQKEFCFSTKTRSSFQFYAIFFESSAEIVPLIEVYLRSVINISSIASQLDIKSQYDQIQLDRIQSEFRLNYINTVSLKFYLPHADQTISKSNQNPTNSSDSNILLILKHQQQELDFETTIRRGECTIITPKSDNITIQIIRQPQQLNDLETDIYSIDFDQLHVFSYFREDNFMNKKSKKLPKISNIFWKGWLPFDTIGRMKLLCESIDFNSDTTIQFHQKESESSPLNIMLLLPFHRPGEQNRNGHEKTLMWFPAGKVDGRYGLFIPARKMQTLKSYGFILLQILIQSPVQAQVTSSLYEFNRAFFSSISRHTFRVDLFNLMHIDIINLLENSNENDNAIQKTLQVYLINNLDSKESTTTRISLNRKDAQQTSNRNQWWIEDQQYLYISMCCSSYDQMLIVQIGYIYSRSIQENKIENRLVNYYSNPINGLPQVRFICPNYSFDDDKAVKIEESISKSYEYLYMRINSESEMEHINGAFGDSHELVNDKFQFKRLSRPFKFHNTTCIFIKKFDIENQQTSNSIEIQIDPKKDEQTIQFRGFFRKIFIDLNSNYMFSIQQSSENHIEYEVNTERSRFKTLNNTDLAFTSTSIDILNEYTQIVYWEMSIVLTRTSLEYITITYSVPYYPNPTYSLFLFKIKNKANYTILTHSDTNDPVILPLAYRFATPNIGYAFIIQNGSPLTQIHSTIKSNTTNNFLSVDFPTNPYQYLVIIIPPNNAAPNSYISIKQDSNSHLIPINAEILPNSIYTSNLFEQKKEKHNDANEQEEERNSFKFLLIPAGFWKIYLIPCNSNHFFQREEKFGFLIFPPLSEVEVDQKFYINPSMQITSEEFAKVTGGNRKQFESKWCFWHEEKDNSFNIHPIKVTQISDSKTIDSYSAIRNEVSDLQFDIDSLDIPDFYIFKSIRSMVYNKYLTILFDSVTKKLIQRSDFIYVRFKSELEQKIFTQKVSTSKQFFQVFLRDSQFFEIYAITAIINRRFRYFITDKSISKHFNSATKHSKLIPFEHNFFEIPQSEELFTYIQINQKEEEEEDQNADIQNQQKITTQQLSSNVFIISDQQISNIITLDPVSFENDKVFAYIISTELPHVTLSIHILNKPLQTSMLVINHCCLSSISNQWKLFQNNSISTFFEKQNKNENELNQYPVLFVGKTNPISVAFNEKFLLPKELRHAILISSQEIQRNRTELLFHKPVFNLFEWKVFKIDTRVAKNQIMSIDSFLELSPENQECSNDNSDNESIIIIMISIIALSILLVLLFHFQQKLQSKFSEANSYLLS